MEIPKTMHAVVVADDEKRSLRWQEVPCPAPGPGEVLVRVRATALNRADLLQRIGRYPVPAGASTIMGLEMSGEVAGCGRGVSNWSTGDRVACLLEGGGYAEYVLCHAGMLLPLPADMSLEQAASLPEAYYTAYLNLYLEAELKPGETALIHAGSSGVGTAAIQLCRALGNRVYASTSPAKMSTVAALGADLVFDRTDDLFGAIRKAAPEGVDVILDPVGASYLDGNLKVLKRRGRMVLIGLLGGAKGEIALNRLLMKRIRLIGSVLRSRKRQEKLRITAAFKRDVWSHFDAGSLRPVIHSVFPIAAVEEAHELMRSNQAIGKIVLTLPS